MSNNNRNSRKFEMTASGLRACIAAAVAVSLHCGLFEPRENKGSIAIVIQSEKEEVLAKALEALSSVEYELTKGGATIRSGSLERNGGYFEGTLSDLDPGDDYGVSLTGLDGNDDIIGTGSDNQISVAAGQTATAKISWIKFKPVLSSPAPEATGISTSPMLIWNSVSGAYSFGLQVSTSSSFSTLVYNQSRITTTSRQVTGLSEGTTYYWRVNATGSGGTSAWSEAWNFTTNTGQQGTITDIDGNIYHTIVIGTQTWTVENLRVTRYRNGDAIPNITDGSSWAASSAGAYCVYDNKPSNTATYGCLYNWYAVSDSRNIASPGWHVPTDAEWQTLVDYLGGSSVAGGKMKETAYSHWRSPNSGATNESGFSALPGGYRHDSDGTFVNLGSYAYFWSSSESGAYYAWHLYLYYASSVASRGSHLKRTGFSVRLVRD
jgi:uncharacterized protein (TIGR02145 family)